MPIREIIMYININKGSLILDISSYQYVIKNKTNKNNIDIYLKDFNSLETILIGLAKHEISFEYRPFKTITVHNAKIVDEKYTDINIYNYLKVN